MMGPEDFTLTGGRDDPAALQCPICYEELDVNNGTLPEAWALAGHHLRLNHADTIEGELVTNERSGAIGAGA